MPFWLHWIKDRLASWRRWWTDPHDGVDYGKAMDAAFRRPSDKEFKIDEGDRLP